MPSFIESLLKSLNIAEKEYIEKHFASRSNSENLLTSKYIIQTLNKVKKTPQINVNKMLISRVFEEVVDTMISNNYLSTGKFSAHDKLLLKLKKKILFARIISKNLNPDIMKSFKIFLNTLISEAEKAEIYEVVIEALLIKKYFFALKEGAEEFQKTHKKIEHIEACQKQIYHAADCYFAIVINNDLIKFRNTKSLNEFIVKSIRILKADYNKYKSAQIKYYMHIISMYYYETQKKYNIASKYAKNIFSIVKSTPVLYREERLGFALINLSQYKTISGNYSLAAKYAKESQSYYLKNSNNYLISKNLEYLIYFYKGNYSKAHICLRELLEQNLSDSGLFTRSKYIYYNSALLFQQNQFRKSIILLRKSLEIEKDKTRWNISLRVLNIMLFIEMNKINEAFSHLESLRKYMERTGKTDEVSERDILIVKLLREMEKKGFEWDPENKTAVKILDSLTEKESSVAWEYFSAELIPFHEWVRKKVKKSQQSS